MGVDVYDGDCRIEGDCETIEEGKRAHLLAPDADHGARFKIDCGKLKAHVESHGATG